MVTALCAASTTEVRIMLLTDAALKNMNITQSNIYPVSQARNMFSRLIDQIGTTKALYVTKKGKIRAALIDIDYLQKMQQAMAKQNHTQGGRGSVTFCMAQQLSLR